MIHNHANAPSLGMNEEIPPTKNKKKKNIWNATQQKILTLTLTKS
jgi:hypothetical protein